MVVDSNAAIKINSRKRRNRFQAPEQSRAFFALTACCFRSFHVCVFNRNDFLDFGR
jgi:hypothetical protein